jgi:hypothetical protein
MSRGHGRTQNALIAALRSGGLRDTFELACVAFDVPEVAGVRSLTAAQLASTRRALAQLQREGLVCGLRVGWRDGRQRWGSPEAVAAYRKRERAVFGVR